MADTNKPVPPENKVTSGGVTTQTTTTSKPSEPNKPNEPVKTSSGSTQLNPTGRTDVSVKSVEKSVDSTEKDTMLKETQEILKEYGNQESNIPLSSSYWDLMNRMRALQNKGTKNV